MTLLLGLGIIGSRCADNLIAAGIDLKTWNRTPKDRADSVTDLSAADADIVLCYLMDEHAVKDVFSQIAPSLGEGKTFINHATIDPETTMWLDAQCRALGCDFLDCPFTGSKDASAGGNLVYYVSGKPELLEKHRSLLEITSREIMFLGPPPAATVVKITTNLVTASTVTALAEALEISRRHGVDPRDYEKALQLNASYAP
ncbi:NAD(P)-binding domain-containing protein, partial [Akkermansiaceae bacterium]|nr:NAD(P)-binding domain-containing protein [Akkermansiaceae bacterium]